MLIKLFTCACVSAVTLLMPASVAGQGKAWDNVSLSANYYSGFLLPEYSNIAYLAEEPVRSFSVALSKTTRGRTVWEQLYNFPSYGVRFFYSTLGNDQVHGRELALYPYFTLYILSGKKFSFYNETGIGLAYITKKFDFEENYRNVAVGSHVNIHFNLRFGLGYELTERMTARGGLSFEHFSNAKTRDPNLGLNYVTGFAGLTYQLGDETPKVLRELPAHKATRNYEFVLSVGSKHPTGLISKSYLTSSASFEVKWQLTRVFGFGIGPDLFYDTSTEIEMITVEETGYKDVYDFRTGIHLSQEFEYGRLSLILHEGIYVGLIDRVNKRWMYNRGIIRYRPFERCFFQLALKSHMHVLDYPELGFGLKW